MKLLSLLSLVTLLFVGCSEKTGAPTEYLISSLEKDAGATTAGNLVTTALKEVHDLDIVFYPSAFLNKDKYGVVKLNMSDDEINEILNIYPTDNDDQFSVGTMEGKSIKKFVLQRARETYAAELQVAGVRYDIRFTGGVPTIHNVLLNRYTELDDNRVYRVALSETFMFNGRTLPGYLFRNNMNFNFTSLPSLWLSGHY